MQRVVPGLIMAAAWAGLLLWAPFSLFWTVFILVALLALHEYWRMVWPELSPGRTLILVLVSAGPVYGAGKGDPGLVLAGLVFSFLLVLPLVFRWMREVDGLARVMAWLCLALILIGLGLAHLVLIRGLDNGVAWLVFLTAVTIGSDTGAYYCGRRFGHRKLCPRISPGKTVAGGVGGLVAGTLVAVILEKIMVPEANLFLLLLLAPILVVIGIGGDLSESVLKRCAGVKDSSRLLAGHGGLLDRIDSLLLTAPVLYWLLILFFGGAA